MSVASGPTRTYPSDAKRTAARRDLTRTHRQASRERERVAVGSEIITGAVPPAAPPALIEAVLRAACHVWAASRISTWHVTLSGSAFGGGALGRVTCVTSLLAAGSDAGGIKGNPPPLRSVKVGDAWNGRGERMVTIFFPIRGSSAGAPSTRGLATPRPPDA